jgi:hypothetical protein
MTSSRMPDSLNELAQQLTQFAKERDWQQFHSPKKLASALIVDAGELLEHFPLEMQFRAGHAREVRATICLMSSRGVAHVMSPPLATMHPCPAILYPTSRKPAGAAPIGAAWWLVRTPVARA